MNITQRRLRRKLVITVVPMFLIIVAFYGLTYGSVTISLQEIWAVFHADGQPVHEKKSL